MFSRNKIASLVAEFLGTGFLTLLILSSQHSGLPATFFIAGATGFGIAVLTTLFSDVSGAYFNPAIAIGLFVARKLGFFRTLLYVAVQMLAGYLAYLIFTYVINTHPVSLSAPFASATTKSFSGRGFLIEAIGTGIFAFAFAKVVDMRAVKPKMHQAAQLGSAYFVGSMIAGASLVTALTTQGEETSKSISLGLLNPALALGDHAFTVNTVLAPIVGALIAFAIYKLLLDETTNISRFVSSASTAPQVVEMEIVETVVETKPAKKTSKSSTAKKSSSKSAAAKKPAAKKAPAKKPAARSASAKRSTAKRR